MARKGVDFSGARPSPRTLQAAGIECVLFYVGARGDWRMPPRSLIDSYLGAGIECAAIYEEGDGGFARQGYQRGLQVGQNARRFLDGYGWGGPAYVATDVDITGAQIPAAIDAYKGVRDGMGPHEAGIYGGGLIVEAVRTQLGYRLLWRANATSWHHGAAANGLLVQQHIGPAPGVPDTDLNTVYVDRGGYWGQWAPGSITPSPQQPAKDWFDMATKDDLKAAIREVLAEDEVKSEFALKNKQALDGTLRLQAEQAGQPSKWRDGQDLLSVRDDHNTVVLDQLDPRRGTGVRPNPDAKPVRDFIERIPEP